MLDPVPTAARIRRGIARMVVQYQNKGRYLDLDGNWRENSDGILNAWEELDKMGAPLVDSPGNGIIAQN